MMYLEKKLTKEETDKLNEFAKSLGSSINGLCDTMATGLIGEFSLDVFALDDLIAKNVPEYDHIECKYKGNEVSCADVVRMVYGEEIEKILLKLL